MNKAWTWLKMAVYSVFTLSWNSMPVEAPASIEAPVPTPALPEKEQGLLPVEKPVLIAPIATKKPKRKPRKKPTNKK